MFKKKGRRTILLHCRLVRCPGMSQPKLSAHVLSSWLKHWIGKFVMTDLFRLTSIAISYSFLAYVFKYEIKTKRHFLKRCKQEIKLSDLYIGNMITILARTFKIVDFSDAYTSRVLAGNQQKYYWNLNLFWVGSIVFINFITLL